MMMTIPPLAPAILALAWPDPSAAPAPTFHKDIAPILQRKCQECHRPGQVGPFPLLTYKDARRWSGMIAEVVDDGRMPPWHADARPGVFANDRRLTPEQKELLSAWVDAGAPEGDPADAPPPRAFSEGWTIGEPDAVLTMPRPFSVKAEGTIPYQHFIVPTDFAEDKWVRGVEVRPGNRAVVHHVLVFVLDRGDSGRKVDEAGGRNQLAAYVPGNSSVMFPAGMAKKIPTGASLLFQVHYTPVGKPAEDRSSIGLVFAREPVTRRVVTRGASPLRGDRDDRLRIPANDPNYEVRAETRLGADAILLNLSPHMHLRGKDFTFIARYPDGRSETLLSVPRYDFNWQTRYSLADPKELPAGTVIECIAHFDNSKGNKANPDPDRVVTWGPQTTDEMMIGYFDLVLDRPAEGPDAESPLDPAGEGGRPLAQLRELGRRLNLADEQREKVLGLMSEYRGRYRTPEFRKALEEILDPEQRKTLGEFFRGRQ